MTKLMSLSLSRSNRTVTATFFASGDELALERAVLAVETCGRRGFLLRKMAKF